MSIKIIVERGLRKINESHFQYLQQSAGKGIEIFFNQIYKLNITVIWTDYFR